jgi:phage baseplate assembly protein W
MADENKDRNFIGTGWSFPPQFDIASKSVAMTGEELDIDNSLSILFSTVVGERVMDMKYGCNMDALVFESLDTSIITFIKTKIEKAILFYESRIELKKVNINTQNILEGLILIEVDYIVSATNSRYNFVYPFWQEEGTELQSIIKFNK